VAIFVVFMLIGSGTAASRPTGTWAEVEVQTKRYIVYKALLSAFTGIAVGGVLWFLGVDLAMVFGLFAFLLNFIPSIGSIIATLLPLPVVLMSPDLSMTAAILAIAIPGAIQFTVGNVIEPKIMGDELDLHPVTILLTLIVWGMLWGIVGMLLATPITAVMKILFSKNEVTAPIADIMAGRLDRLRDA
jgi:AI-2 transport protein TqsA